jgi:uncharacterized protein
MTKKLEQPNFDELWKLTESLCPRSNDDWIHGFTHFKNVETNAVLLAKTTEADITVVRLFAMFHDIKRINDNKDPLHGLRATEFIQQTCYGEYFTIDPIQMQELTYACTWHSCKFFSTNKTIGTCWDADRLELTRFKHALDLNLFSTKQGKVLAQLANDQLPEKSPAI